MKSRRLALPLFGTLALTLAVPALAQVAPPPPTVDAEGRVYGGQVDPRPEWPGGPAATAQPPMAQPAAAPGYDRMAWEQARAGWLTECRRRQGHGKLVGGAVLGGLVGGVVGNRIAGEGNRTEGTVIGAAVGAVAGGAIGDSADKRAARDYCEAYLDQYTAQQSYGYGYGYGHGAYAYGYAPMMVMVPVAMVPVAAPAPQQQRECKETQVIEEWVPVPTRPHTRYIPRRVPDKRVRIVPDKRVRVN